MSISIDLDKVKDGYLNAEFNATKYDFMIQEAIDGVISQAVDYLDSDDYTGQDDLPPVLERPLCKQIAYEFRRRKDLGLSSLTVGDGNVQKYPVDEWLPQVQQVLDRTMKITI